MSSFSDYKKAATGATDFWLILFLGFFSSPPQQAGIVSQGMKETSSGT